MLKRTLFLPSLALLFLAFGGTRSFAANGLPTVNTFSITASAVSPVPITALTASDSDGTVVGYLVNESSTKPAANASGWTSTPWTSYPTTKIGSLTLYAWAKDNAGGVSAYKSAVTTVIGGHVHDAANIVSGKLDVARLNVGTTIGTIAAGNHNHDGIYQKKYANVIVVATSGGDFTDPISAINSITDASSANPYLMKIMPGIYDLGSSTLYMKPYVDIEGSGENSTIILSTVGNAYWQHPFCTVYGASDAEIRFLTVTNAGTGSQTGAFGNVSASTTLNFVTLTNTGVSPKPFGIVNVQGSQAVLTNVTVAISGSGGYGIYGDGSTGILNSVYVSAPAGSSAIREVYSSDTMINVHAVGGIGLDVGPNVGTISADRSTFEGSTYSIKTFGPTESPAATIRIGASKLAGSISGGDGFMTCAASYNGNYVGLDNTCH